MTFPPRDLRPDGLAGPAILAQQKAALLLAIDRAQGAGACSYIGGCVVAQLADIVDPTGETRRFLERGEAEDPDQDGGPTLTELWVALGTTDLSHRSIGEFDYFVVHDLQQLWDHAGGKDADGNNLPASPQQAESIRAKMRALVEAM